MYDTLCHNYYWIHMAKDMKDIVETLAFSASGSLDFFTMDILGWLPNGLKRDHFVLIMNNMYPKLMRTWSLSKMTALHAVLTSIVNCIMH